VQQTVRIDHYCVQLNDPWQPVNTYECTYTSVIKQYNLAVWYWPNVKTVTVRRIGR